MAVWLVCAPPPGGVPELVVVAVGDAVEAAVLGLLTGTGGGPVLLVDLALGFLLSPFSHHFSDAPV